MTTASTTGEGRARLDFDLGDDEPVISPETTHQKIQEISEKAGFNAVRRAAPQSNQKESIFISRRFSQSAAVGAALKPDAHFRSTPKSDLKPMKGSARFQTRPRRGKAAP